MTVTTLERSSDSGRLKLQRDTVELEISQKKTEVVRLGREADELRKQRLARGTRSTGATSPEEQKRRKIAKLESEIVSREKDLELLIDMLNSADHVETRQKIADAMKLSEELKAQERELWKELVTAFAAFGQAWLALLDHYRSWLQLRNQMRHKYEGKLSGDALSAWAGAWNPAVRIPVNPGVAFGLLWDVCVRRAHGTLTSVATQLGDIAPDLSHLAEPFVVPADIDRHTGSGESWE